MNSKMKQILDLKDETIGYQKELISSLKQIIENQSEAIKELQIRLDFERFDKNKAFEIRTLENKSTSMIRSEISIEEQNSTEQKIISDYWLITGKFEVV